MYDWAFDKELKVDDYASHLVFCSYCQVSPMLLMKLNFRCAAR